MTPPRRPAQAGKRPAPMSYSPEGQNARHGPPLAHGGMIERIERALVMAAYIVIRHGPKYAPYVDRLERELEAARRDDPVIRAQRILDEYAERGIYPTSGTEPR